MQKGVDVNLHNVQCIGDLGTSIIIVAVLSTVITMAASYRHFARSIKNIGLKSSLQIQEIHH
jgi:hypothetical protein